MNKITFFTIGEKKLESIKDFKTNEYVEDLRFK
jgi:hypothetical protein